MEKFSNDHEEYTLGDFSYDFTNSGNPDSDGSKFFDYLMDRFVEIRNSSAEFLHNKTQYSEEETRSWFVDNCTGMFPLYRYVWVHAKSYQNVIGYFRFTRGGPRKVYIGMDLHPDYRNQGIGTALYKKFLLHFAAWAAPSDLYLRVLKTNERAIHLYRKLEFTVTEETDIDFEMRWDPADPPKFLIPDSRFYFHYPA